MKEMPQQLKQNLIGITLGNKKCTYFKIYQIIQKYQITIPCILAVTECLFF